MLRNLLLSLGLILCANSAQAAVDPYTFDKDHTHIIFFVSHVGFSDMIGRLKAFDGSFTFDEKEPEKSSVDVKLKSDSIDTDVPALNKTLQTDKFFNVAKYPTMRFKSERIVVTGKNTGDIIGDFTLLGVTRPLTLHVTYNRSGIHPYTNNYVSGFSADAVLKRSDFGMNAYLPAVGDEVRIHIEAEGIDPLKHPGGSKAPH
jgi:polyisoprenoid-binding protein YceI